MYKTIDIDEQSNTESWWEAVAYNAKASTEELIAALKKQSRQYIGAHDLDCIEAIMRGELRHLETFRVAPIKNKINYQLLRQTWGARLVNGHTSDKDGILRYMAVGTNNTEPTSSQSGLLNEFYRTTPETKKHTGALQKFILRLDFAQANLNNDTTVANGTWSKTVFEVASISGFYAGAAIRVKGGLTSFSRIQSISGNEITLDPNEPLLETPIEGYEVNLCIGETGSFGGETATETEDSGDLYARSKLRLYKNEDLAYFIKQTFIGAAL